MEVLSTLLLGLAAALFLATQCYTMLLTFVRVALHTYFRRIQICGVNNLPREGPVILSSVHPNMLIDPLLVLSECSKLGRQPFVWAKGSLFRHPLVAWLLYRLGAVPVYRPSNPENKLQDVDSDKSPDEIERANREMFTHTWEMLAKGEAMLLFPEGTSYTAPKMLSLKSGIVRLATGYVKNFGEPISIVPVGLTYFNKQHFRSQMVLEFGAPYVIRPEDVSTTAFVQDEFQEVKRMKMALAERMRGVTLNADDFETLQVARMMRRLFVKGAIEVNKEVRLTQRIIDVLEAGSADDGKRLRVESIKGKVERYEEALSKLRIKDRDLVFPVTKDSAAKLFLERVLYLLVLLPLATPGLVLYSPYFFVGKKLNKMAGYVESRSQFKIFAAAFLVPLHWLLLILLTWYLYGSSSAWTLAMLLPFLYYSHIRVLEESRGVLEHIVFLFTIARHSANVQALRKERQMLRQDVHEFLSTYLDGAFLADISKQSPGSKHPTTHNIIHRTTSSSDAFYR